MIQKMGHAFNEIDMNLSQSIGNREHDKKQKFMKQK